MKSIDKSARIALQAVDDLLEAQGVPVAELTPLPSDPYEFLTCCCYTYDELAKTIGLDPKRAFPDKEYLRIIVQQWLANPMFHIEKSRQIMVTWIFAALWLWWVLKHPGQRVAWICKTFNDASDHIEKRIAKMYEQIPASYQKPAAKFVDGEFRVYHNPDSQIPTSTIEAIAAEGQKERRGQSVEVFHVFGDQLGRSTVPTRSGRSVRSRYAVYRYRGEIQYLRERQRSRACLEAGARQDGR
jgi:hypothetical protein